jgi:hypothetical protein
MRDTSHKITINMPVVPSPESRRDCCECLFPQVPETLSFPDENLELPADLRRPEPRLRSDGTISMSDLPWNVSYKINHGRSTRSFTILTRSRCICMFGIWSILILLGITLSLLIMTIFMDLDKAGYEKEFIKSPATILGFTCINYREDISSGFYPFQQNQTHLRGLRVPGLPISGRTKNPPNVFYVVYSVNYTPKQQDVPPEFSGVSIFNQFATDSFELMNSCKSKIQELLGSTSTNIMNGVYDKQCTITFQEEYIDNCYYPSIPEYSIAGFIFLGCISVILTLCGFGWYIFYCGMIYSHSQTMFVYVPPKMIQ